jgi:hypothetical protein
MDTEKIKAEIISALCMPLGAHTAKLSVDMTWLVYFANRILEANRKCEQALAADAIPETAADPVAQTLPEEKPVVQKVVQKATKPDPVKPTEAPEPPAGAISHQDMLDIILARREIKTARELGEMVGVHPAMIQQICKGSTPVSERVARGFGYQRHKVCDQFWFTKIKIQPDNQSKPAPLASNIKSNNSRDGMPQIIRTSPFKGAPKVINPGPFQQLLDAQLASGDQQ